MTLSPSPLLRPLFTTTTAPLLLRATSRRAFSSSPVSPLSKITLIGRLAAAPDLHTTTSGAEYIRYSLGVSTGPRDESGQQATSWFRIANFNTQEGSRAREYLLGLEKGTLVYVEGDASMNVYQDKETGKNVSALNIVQKSLEVLKRNKGPEGGVGQ